MKPYDLKSKALFVVLVFLLLFSGREVWNTVQKDKLIMKQASQIKSLDVNTSILKYNMMEQMASTAISFRAPTILEGYQNRVKLLPQLKLGSLLAVRISPLSCSICVDSTMIVLRKFIAKNNLAERVIILTSYNKERDLVLFRRLHQMGNITIFNIKEDEIPLPIESEKKPYMFLIDSSMTSRSVFIPEKTISGLTDLYLKCIKKEIVLGSNK